MLSVVLIVVRGSTLAFYSMPSVRILSRSLHPHVYTARLLETEQKNKSRTLVIRERIFFLTAPCV